MKVALEDAGMMPSDIDYINVHGTSTPLGDIAESKAILSVFGKDAYNLNISSTKSMTGHLLGGAGAIESLACILAVSEDIIPPTINHFTDDPEFDPNLNFTFNVAQKRTVRAALSNTFGFGGHNGSVIFKNSRTNPNTLKGLLSQFLGNNPLSNKIYRVTGIKPGKLRIYQEALRHSSMSDPRSVDQIKNNERLEFLGDAILDAIVAEILFQQFPKRNEGFLTEMRTRIVNREQLGYLASKLGLVEIMEIKRDLYSNKIAMKTIGGNALEALIGAIYLDKGFSAAREFVSQRLVGQYLDMEKLMATAVSHKALVMKWAQQNHRSLRFDIESQIDNRNDLHSVSLVIDDEIWFTEINHSRKKAEELCSEKACRKLGL